MKLWTAAVAPNPRRVAIYLAEKGIEIPTVVLDLAKGENHAPEFLTRNSLGRVPVLEFDDGSHLAESMAICRYFEEIQPEPPLFGVGARERADVEMWNRRMENEIAMPAMASFRNTHEFFKDRIPQVPEYGAVAKEHATARLAWLDEELADREFVAGDRYTIADITAQVGIDFGAVAGIKIAPEQKNLGRWHAAVSSRPCAKA